MRHENTLLLTPFDYKNYNTKIKFHDVLRNGIIKINFTKTNYVRNDNYFFIEIIPTTEKNSDYEFMFTESEIKSLYLFLKEFNLESNIIILYEDEDDNKNKKSVSYKKNPKHITIVFKEILKGLERTIGINISKVEFESFLKSLDIFQSSIEVNKQVNLLLDEYKNNLSKWVKENKVHDITVTNLFDDTFTVPGELCVKVEIEFNNSNYDDVIYGYKYKTIIKPDFNAVLANQLERNIFDQLTADCEYNPDINIYIKGYDPVKEKEKYMNEARKAIKNRNIENVYNLPDDEVKPVLEKFNIPFSEFKRAREAHKHIKENTRDLTKPIIYSKQ